MFALEANDLPGLLDMLAPQASSLREDARRAFSRVAITSARFGALTVEVRDDSDPATAKARFLVAISGKDTAGESPYEQFRQWFTIQFERQGDRWLMTSYTTDDLRDALP